MEASGEKRWTEETVTMAERGRLGAGRTRGKLRLRAANSRSAALMPYRVKMAESMRTLPNAQRTAPNLPERVGGQRNGLQWTFPLRQRTDEQPKG